TSLVALGDGRWRAASGVEFEGKLSPGSLRGVPLRDEERQHLVRVIALHLEDEEGLRVGALVRLQRAAGAAELLELGEKLLGVGAREKKGSDGRHRLAATARGLPADAGGLGTRLG